MNKRMYYAALESLIRRLGFQEEQTGGPHHLWEQSDFDAQIVLPPYQPADEVQPHHWMHVRWLLEAKGILDGEAFDSRMEALSESAPEGSPTPTASRAD